MTTSPIQFTLKAPDAIRREIAALVQQYSDIVHLAKPFVPGESLVPPSGKVIGSQELKYMVEASLDGWLTTGRFNVEFEKKLAEYAEVDILSFKKTSAKYKISFKNPISLLRAIFLIKRYSKVYVHYAQEHFFFSARNVARILNIVLLPMYLYIFSR